MKISKSKKELASIISQNGGWREGAESAAQCKSDNAVSFYRDAPDRDGDCWWGDHIYSGDINQDKLIANWHQTVLSRAEYFHLYPAPDDDGWIYWGGGERPVSESERVDIKLRMGEVWLDRGSLWRWSHDGHGTDIIAYRLHKPEQAKSTSVGDDETNQAAKEELGAMELGESPEQRAKLAKIYAPTIEQLAADYRDAKGYAERKQQEADAAKVDAEAKLKVLELAGKAIGLTLSVDDAAPVSTKFTGRFHSAKRGDRPGDLDVICDGCGKRFGTHVGFDCRP